MYEWLYHERKAAGGAPPVASTRAWQTDSTRPGVQSVSITSRYGRMSCQPCCCCHSPHCSYQQYRQGHWGCWFHRCAAHATAPATVHPGRWAPTRACTPAECSSWRPAPPCAARASYPATLRFAPHAVVGRVVPTAAAMHRLCCSSRHPFRKPPPALALAPLRYPLAPAAKLPSRCC